MQTRKLFATVVALACLTGCGGGGGDTRTEGVRQTRTKLDPDEAIDFVKAAIELGATMNQFDEYFRIFAPRSTSSPDQQPKATGIGSCRLVSFDTACEGNVRIETEFPLNQAQANYKSGSTLSIQWENIRGDDFATTGAINRKDIFTFVTDVPSTSPRSGQFKVSATQTSPSSGRRDDEFVLKNLSVTVDSPSNSFIINGNATINPTTVSSVLSVDLSEDITFNQWLGVRAVRQPGSSVTLNARRYLTAAPTTTSPSARVVVSVISSETSQTEYTVEAKSSSDTNSTTRTVIGTIDSARKINYSAS